MATHLISILVPVYNSAGYLSELVASVVAQTYDEWELVLVDDCSSDESWTLLEQLADQDRRIRVFKNSLNKGPSATINRAAGVAHGSLLARLDADDTMKPSRLAEQKKYLDDHPQVGLLGSYYRNIDQGGRPGTIVRSGITSGPALRAKFLFANPMGHSTVMIRRTAFEQVGGYDERLKASLDYDFLARLSKITDTAILPKPLVDYRTHGGNITTRKSDLQLRNAEIIQRELLRDYGFSVSDAQLEVHYRCHLHRYLVQGRANAELIRLGREWLADLRSQNRDRAIFPQPAFETVLAEVHTGIYARRNSTLRLWDYLRTFTTDFGSLKPAHAIQQVGHSLKNGL